VSICEPKRTKDHGMILKLDVETAYNGAMRWDILEEEVIGRGFPQKVDQLGYADCQRRTCMHQFFT